MNQQLVNAELDLVAVQHRGGIGPQTHAVQQHFVIPHPADRNAAILSSHDHGVGSSDAGEAQSA